ncbi:IS110 family transposase [Variovorax sp. J31P179]|uniref:IS110 family transposase n=1 Tax=Variovorax sp. J31P179 TaxID=3053508 RepID=UPI0025752E3C|nr:IS110 family transposase [Variovorax sp. J31P179]MDM0082806.1 IS110 family transposase [Variovorax sp. J31P179]
MNRSAAQGAGQIIGLIDGRQVVGLDVAKSVFQLHTVDMDSGEIVSVQLKRAKVLEHFINRQPCLIGIEACGGAHHWARQLTGLGHSVRLIHAKAVRPFVAGNKTDATDARAIWLAVQQPGTKFVGMKTLEQQATLVLHRQRELLMRMKVMQTNALRGLLYEFGAIFARGRGALFSEIEATLESLVNDIPQYVVDSLREQAHRIKKIAEDIKAIEVRLAQRLRADADMKRVAAIPGVGLMTATAAVATMGEATAFKSAREFCAWLGLVPSQRGTGGKVKLLGISKRGDTYLRTLLIHGARSVLTHTKEPGVWLEQLQARRPANVVIVAQAAKMARTIWAVTARQQDYQRGYVSSRPQVRA